MRKPVPTGSGVLFLIFMHIFTFPGSIFSTESSYSLNLPMLSDSDIHFSAGILQWAVVSEVGVLQ